MILILILTIVRTNKLCMSVGGHCRRFDAGLSKLSPTPSKCDSYVHTLTHTLSHTDTHSQTYINTHSLTHTLPYHSLTHSHKHTHSYAYTDTSIRTRTQTSTHRSYAIFLKISFHSLAKLLILRTSSLFFFCLFSSFVGVRLQTGRSF